jgi:hypothetical protein
VFRRLITLVAVATAFAVLVPAALAAVRVHVRVEGKTTTIFGAAEPTLASGTNALAALEAASLAGEFYYHLSPGPFVDQIGRYKGEGFSGWSYKVNGVSPPIAADQATIEAGDTVLWYWTTFSEQGGSPTLLLAQWHPSRARSGKPLRNCYRVLSQNDLGQTSPATGATLRVDGRRVATRNGRGCIGRQRGGVRATAPHAVRSNALR